MTQNKALESAKNIVDYCKEQSSCQNCIFRKYGAESFDCNIKAFDVQEVLSNIQAKKKNNGWI